jgi:formiminotetrahydrofolate cyclodeaminase
MVARLTIGKKKYAPVEAQMNEILSQAERLRSELSAAVQADSAAFEAVLAAFKLPKETKVQEEARAAAIELATLNAARVPLATAENAVLVMALAERGVALGNLNAISDGASAAALGRAALMGAGYNVRINLASLSDKTRGEELLARLGVLEKKAARLDKEIRKAMQERGGLAMA